MNSMTTLHTSITQHIIEAMKSARETGLPWLQNHGLPINAATGHHYRGINILHLWIAGRNQAFSSSTWATYQQWQSLGAQVKKGQKSTAVLFYQPVQPHRDSDTAIKERQQYFAITKSSRVFNACQVEGYETPAIPRGNTAESLIQADVFVQNTAATICHEGDRAYYHPRRDTIVMPEKARFIGSRSSTATESYYSVLLHELTHWTGAEHRCNRVMSGRYSSPSYAMEELIAELGAAFLCAELGISNHPRQDHADYMASWIGMLEQHHKAIFTAASQASAAVGFLRGFQG